MANNITGSTDTSGALSVVPVAKKCVIIVGEIKPGSGQTVNTVKEQIFDVLGTADADAKFGTNSPISKLVKILISNGVTYMKGIAIEGYAGSPYASLAEAYAGAMSKTLTDNSVKCVMLDTMDATVIAKLKLHLAQAEAEDLFRYSAIGAIASQTNAQFATLAGVQNDKRIFLSGPNPVDDSNTILGGIYSAAGIISAIMTETADPALPMNGVELLGYGGLERVLLKADKDALVTAGVTPMYVSPSGYPTIFRLVTTYTKDSQAVADPTWQEGTTVFIADDVLETVINTLKVNFKRTKNVARILDAIKTSVIGVLELKNALEIIQNFDKSTVSVIKDPNDLYGALIDYEFQVVTPLYNITIKQHLTF